MSIKLVHKALILCNLSILAGLIKDYVGTYDGAFYVGSAGTFLGGIILLFGNIWQYRQRIKETTSHKQ